MSAPQRPTPDQIAAADPAQSAWVGANAGSGKTRVLTQRVARLLLGGVAPERILCLTYTRAAAAEMQTRLFATLGTWSMLEDAPLADHLTAIAGGGAPDAARLARARRLFAAALETPGGLRIQTIHAFCDGLLRRFPMEAGVSPQFDLLDEQAAARLRTQVLTRMAAEAETGAAGGGAFDLAAFRLNEGGIDGLVSALLAARLPPEADAAALEAALAALYGPAAALDPAQAAARLMAGCDRAGLTHLAGLMAAQGGKNDKASAPLILAALAEPDPARALEVLTGVFLKQGGDPRSRKGFPVKDVLRADPGADDLADALIAWAAEARLAMNAADTVARTRDMQVFGRAFLDRYGAAKAALGALDYDDLIARAGDLLTRSDMAAWVLYRLDRGIEHVLVDEAQDTAPAQWRVIEAITAEFFAGEEPGHPPRTLFVVGDEKQSIYSFQGAEPDEFGTMRDRFAARLTALGRPLLRPQLLTSFRSAPAILSLVDAVFADPGARLGPEAAAVRHIAHRAGDPGRIDLWPLIEPVEAPEPPAWHEPVDAVPPERPKRRLARHLAAAIAGMVSGQRLPDRDGEPGRPVRPGDILVLVRRRDLLAAELIRGLKARGVPVAGADRLALAQGLAVRDLIALAQVALTPGDDLSLAALLRSPLCDLDEAALFALAHGRQGSLWAALMAARDRHPAEAAMLRDMAGRADYLRPYEFFEHALIAHDGRRRLIARLGPEAEDLIDELLAQALGYETREPPSLAGFIAHIQTGDIQVRRDMEQGADEVRVMTVHGAKGLEAPVVILPDTLPTGRAPGSGGTWLVPGLPGGPLLWMPPATGEDAVTGPLRAAAEARAAQEDQRLLYVALTRAQDWLILAGAGTRAGADKGWYGQVARATAPLAGHDLPGPEGMAIRRLGVPSAEPPAAPPRGEVGAAPASPSPADPPPWLCPARAEPRVARLAPSSLGAGMMTAADTAPEMATGQADTVAAASPLLPLDADEARAHGVAVHLLLERLPPLPAPERPAAAARLLAPLPAPRIARALAEALTVLAAPFAADIFGPDTLAEVEAALDLPQLSPLRMLGRIDRLVVTPRSVMVVDYKTDRAPPLAPQGVPPAYAAQLGAYCAGLAGLWPDRQVEGAILWTAVPRLTVLPAALMAAALADARPLRAAAPQALDGPVDGAGRIR